MISLSHTYNSGHISKEHAETLKIEFYKAKYNSLFFSQLVTNSFGKLSPELLLFLKMHDQWSKLEIVFG